MLGLVLFFFGLATLNFALFNGLLQENLLEYIPYLRLELLYGLGPVLFLYSKSVTNPEYKLTKKSYLLLLPVIIELIYYRTSYYREGAINIENFPNNSLQTLFFLEQWIGLIYSTTFMALSVYVLLKYKRWLYDNFSFTQDKSLKWIHTPIVFFVSFWFLWLCIRLPDMLIFSSKYSQYYYYPMFITLSLSSLWIGFQGYIKSKTGAIGFDTSNTSKRKAAIEDETDYDEVIGIIENNMRIEKLYLNQDFNMQFLSLNTGIQAKIISKAINNSLHMNFHEFVNRYRVTEFIERIENDKSKDFTLLAHAYDSGFASKSTFNHIFKKYTNKTPKEYLTDLDNQKAK
jgi:AraC-like DNA-binding protein